MSGRRLKRSKMRYVADRISTWVLIGAGVLGGIIGLLDTVGDPEWLLRNLPFLRHVKDVSSLILIIVALLAIASGLERYAVFDEIRDMLEQARHDNDLAWKGVYGELLETHKTLATKIPVKTFQSREELYKEITRILRTCKGTEIVRSTDLIGHGQEGTDEHVQFLKELASKIGSSKQGGIGMLYKVVVNSSQAEGFQSSARRRRTIFAEHGAEDRIDIRKRRETWGLDVLIIDDDHLFIAFPIRRGSYALRLGVRISEEALVSSVARWYDECVWDLKGKDE